MLQKLDEEVDFFIHLFPTFLARVLGQFALKRVHRFLQSLCIHRYTPNKVHGLFFTYWVNKFQLVILHFNKKKTFKLNKKTESSQKLVRTNENIQQTDRQYSINIDFFWTFTHKFNIAWKKADLYTYSSRGPPSWWQGVFDCCSESIVQRCN